MDINKMIVMAQLKRKIKSYMEERGYTNFKSGNYARYLVYSMVVLLEDMIEASIKYVKKDDKTGLYRFTPEEYRMMIREDERYMNYGKYMSGYNSVVKYNDNVFFNFKYVIESIENRYGDRLNITNEMKNLLAYMMMSVQYDITDLSLKVVRYSGRMTLNDKVLQLTISHIVNEEIGKKIRIKLDSIIQDEKEEKEDREEEEKEEEEEKKEE